jgi:hypothetical protein
MAKRGRPPKKKEVQEPIQEVKESAPIEDVKVDLKKEKKVQDFVSEGMVKNDNIDISDVDYSAAEAKSVAYNPFSESVEEKAYRTPKIENSPMIGEIEEPMFERPSLADLMKDNEAQAEEQVGGEPSDAFSQDEIREMPSKQQEDAAKGLVEQALNLYGLGCKGLAWMSKIKESKVDDLAKDGLIDLSLKVPIDAYTSVSIPQVVEGFNSEVEETFVVSDDFKDSVRPIMTRVFVKRGWGMTDEQQLMFAFGMDFAQKGAVLMQLKKQGDMQIERFMEMTDIARGRNVNFTPPSQPTASPTPKKETPTEIQPTEKKTDTSMVESQNPDLQMNLEDLSQIDVDNV